MAKLQGPKHIEITNPKLTVQDLANQIGYSFNSFADDVNDAFNSRINFDNLNQKITTITVTVDASGAPLQEFVLKYTVTNLQGLRVIRAINTTAINTPPPGAPFITYSLVGANTLKIIAITGLTANIKYQLTVEQVGN